MPYPYLSFALSDDFVASYANTRPAFGFGIGGDNTLGELTFIGKYARRKPDSTKERWYEVCRRVIEGMYSILKDHCLQNRTPWNELKAKRSAEDAYDRMFSFKWLPPGRGLWMMGTEFVHANNNSAALQNCFGGDVTFITRRGVCTLAEMVDQDVEVWGNDGWTKGTVHAFGEREVQRITFAPYNTRSNVRVTVTATPDHRWIMRDGSVNTALAVGDVVPAMATDGCYDFDGIRHGLIFGDGSINYIYANGEYSHMMRLCGEKRSWADLFDNVHLQPNCDGDPVVYYRSPINMKALPATTDLRYLAGFVKGWLETDGTQLNDTTWRLSTQDAGAAEWLREHAASAGWVVNGFNYSSVLETNFGRRSAQLINITLVRPEGKAWTVKSVEPLDEPAQTYCVTVPDVGAFTLASGIYTGNCMFISTRGISSRSVDDSILPFIRLMEASMLGVGVGFDTKGAGKIELNEPDFERTEIYVIEDSREGWYKSLGKLLESYFFEHRATIVFDYLKIRPAGALIMGFGGVAAGPGPLEDLHANLRNVLGGRDGQRLTATDIVDICNMIGKCVVAGNVRRSALLALGDPDDDSFLDLKNWDVNPGRMGPNGWGYTSNNSAEATVGTDYSYLAERIVSNGEPGLIYTDLCRKYGRLVDEPTNRDYRVAGCNPCVAGETMVMTTAGPRRADQLLLTPFWAVVNGKAYHSRTGMYETRVADLHRLQTKEGYSLLVTGNHKIRTADGYMVPAERLVPGDQIEINNHRDVAGWEGRGGEEDGYLIGSFLGDGGWEGNVAVVKVWQRDEGSAAMRHALLSAAQTIPHRSDWQGWRDHGRGYEAMTLPPPYLESWGIARRSKATTDVFETTSSAFHVGLLRGLFDTDGHVEGWQESDRSDKGGSVRLTQVDRSRLELVQRMLLRLGVKSRIYLARAARTEALPGGEYECRESWRLVVSSNDLPVFAGVIGFNHTIKAEKLAKIVARTRFYSKPFVATVESFEFVRTDVVYDCTVDELHLFDANGLVVSNCAEQSLESMELCTLVETFPINCEDLDDWVRTLKYAYLYGKAVTLLPTHWPESNEVMQRNRRIGCSVSGQAQFVEQHGVMVLKDWLNLGYQAIVARDLQYSEWLGVRESIKKTSVKPSGTVSLVAGVTPGVHWPTARGRYVRRVRYRAGDPTVMVLEDAGYEVEPDVMDPKNTVVVAFPVQGPEIRSERDVSVWEKMYLAVHHQRYWADNMVSLTASFRPEEQRDIAAVLKAFDGQLKVIAMLPLLDAGGAYQQMPYEQVTDSEWERLGARVRPIDFDVLYQDGSDAEGEKFCSSDSCELKAYTNMIDVREVAVATS